MFLAPDHFPACPWQGLAELGAPNVKWCEERLCSYINEPANAWSNLAYIAVAAGILWSRRAAAASVSRPPGTAAASDARQRLLAWFAPIIATIGVCSFVYHASNVYVTQILDFIGMYLFCFLLLLLNGMRLGFLARSRFAAAFVGCVGLLSAATAVLSRVGFPIQSLVALLTLGILVSELFIHRQVPSPYSLRNFFLSLGLLLGGAVCSALDVTRRWCDPTNHFLQGHAVWHVLSAFSLLAAYYHYRLCCKEPWLL
jgi:hypothetical protein